MSVNFVGQNVSENCCFDLKRPEILPVISVCSSVWNAKLCLPKMTNAMACGTGQQPVAFPAEAARGDWMQSLSLQNVVHFIVSVVSIVVFN